MLPKLWKGTRLKPREGYKVAQEVLRPGPRVFVFLSFMRLLSGCRWVQAVGLPPQVSRRSSPSSCPVTIWCHNLDVRRSSCRFGCRFAILVFGRCVFPEQLTSHFACSSVWTRGNPGNSGWRSRTAAGLAGVWWVQRQQHYCWACYVSLITF